MKRLFSICLLACAALSAGPQKTSSTVPVDCCPITSQCCPGLFKPCDKVLFGMYGEFLYLQPNGTDLFYGATAIGIDPSLPSPADIASPDWTILEINPSYHPAFEVGLGLLLQDADVEISANWERLRSHDSDSFQAEAAAGHMVGPFFDIGPNSGDYKIGKGDISFRFDTASLMFGKHLCFFNNFHTRFFGAAAFARIGEKLKSTYSNFTGTISRIVRTNSTFTGAGPQMGLDYDYRIHRGLFFSGSSIFSLFMGQMKNTTTYQSYTPELAIIGLGQPNNQATSIPNRTQLVPAFDQKLGFSYIATWESIRALFEIGYRCQIYLDAVQSFNMASQAIPDDLLATPDVGVYAVAFEQTNSNFILTGPYALLGFEF